MVWFRAELVTGLLYAIHAFGAVTVTQQQHFWLSLWLSLASALLFSGNNVAALKGIFCLLREKPVILQRCFVGESKGDPRATGAPCAKTSQGHRRWQSFFDSPFQVSTGTADHS